MTVESTGSENEHRPERVFHRGRILRHRGYGGSVLSHVAGEFQWSHLCDILSVRIINQSFLYQIMICKPNLPTYLPAL